MKAKKWDGALPIKNDLAASLRLMTPQQISLNLIEINLVSIHNEEVMQFLYQKMMNSCFYYENRYLLQSIINADIEKDQKKLITNITQKFDTLFINSCQPSPYQILNQSSLHIQAENILFLQAQSAKKQQKAKCLDLRQTIIRSLSQLSIDLQECGENEEKKEQKLTQTISILNESLLSIKGKDGQFFSPLVLWYRKQCREVYQIFRDSSNYVVTKNRHPLVLNFGFSRFIYKNDDQVAHELIAMELMRYTNKIIGKNQILQYDILPEKIGAFYELVQNAATIHHIKKQNINGLKGYFELFGVDQEKAINRFAQSYAGFCTVQYVLDLKDRNNRNIMVSEDGTIFHIDLAFIFQSKPGGIGFESAPFKMPREYVQVLGGFESDHFQYFQSLLVQNFTKIALHIEQFKTKVEILGARSKQINCFSGFNVKKYFRKFQENLEKIKNFVQDLIADSYDNWRTNKYDVYQLKTNGILC